MTDIPLPDFSGFVPDFDNDQAGSEGWGVFQCDGSENGPFQICKCDDMNIFPSDDEAWVHVVTKAREGSAYHRSALDYIRQHSSIEWTSIGKVHDLSFLNA